MFEQLAKALAAGLSLWEHKEKNKYKERLLELRREYRAEDAKPVGTGDGCRRNNVLDNLWDELCLLNDSWTGQVGEKDS